MESNTNRNDNFAIKLISTENVERKGSSLQKVEEVRRKSKLPWATS